jgi:hypothetical protein
VQLILIGNVPVRYLPDDTNKLMRMVRRPNARSVTHLLSLREPVGDAAGVDDLDLWIVPAGCLRKCQTLGGVLDLYVDDQNADAWVHAEEFESVLNAGRHQDIVPIAQKAIAGQDASQSIAGNQKNKWLSSHAVPLRRVGSAHMVNECLHQGICTVTSVTIRIEVCGYIAVAAHVAREEDGVEETGSKRGPAASETVDALGIKAPAFIVADVDL